MCWVRCEASTIVKVAQGIRAWQNLRTLIQCLKSLLGSVMLGSPRLSTRCVLASLWVSKIALSRTYLAKWLTDKRYDLQPITEASNARSLKFHNLSRLTFKKWISFLRACSQGYQRISATWCKTAVRSTRLIYLNSQRTWAASRALLLALPPLVLPVVVTSRPRANKPSKLARCKQRARVWKPRWTRPRVCLVTTSSPSTRRIWQTSSPAKTSN